MMDPLTPPGETPSGGRGRWGLVEEAGRWKAQIAFSGLTWGSKEEAGLL